MATKKKRDRRHDNPGRPPTPNGEATAYVRCPAAMHEGMIARAKRDGVPVAEVWRRAAAAWLGGGE